MCRGRLVLLLTFLYTGNTLVCSWLILRESACVILHDSQRACLRGRISLNHMERFCRILRESRPQEPPKQSVAAAAAGRRPQNDELSNILISL